MESTRSFFRMHRDNELSSYDHWSADFSPPERRLRNKFRVTRFMESPQEIDAVHWENELPGGCSAGVLACESTRRLPVFVLAARRRRNSQPGRPRYEVHGKSPGNRWRALGP